MDWTGFEALMEKQLDGHLLGIIHERNNSKLPQIFRRDFATTLLLDIIQAQEIIFIVEELYASRTIQSCHRFRREILLLLLILPEVHNLLHPCIRDAKIWRENEKMGRKWRKNEDMEREYRNGERMRKFREIHSLLFLISTLFPPPLSIHFLYQKLTHFVTKW